MEIALKIIVGVISTIAAGYLLWFLKTRISNRTCSARRETQEKSIAALSDCLEGGIIEQKERYNELREDLNTRHKELRVDMQTNIANIRTDVKDGLKRVDTKVDQLCGAVLKWQKENKKTF